MLKIIKLNIIFVLILLFGGIMAQNNESNKNMSVEEEVSELISKCWSLREKNPDSAIVLGLKAHKIAEKYKLTDEHAKVNGYLGVIYFHYKYDMKTAIPYLQESLRMSMLVGDSTRLAYSYNNLGDVYMMSGNISLALQYSEESIRIFKNLGNKMGVAYGYINMGLISQEEKKYVQAHDYFKKALKIRSELGDSTGYASALYQLARSQQYQGKLDKALANFTKSYNHHLKINNLTYTASCLNGIATIYFMRGEYQKSLDNFLQAIDLHMQKNHSFGLVEDYLGIAMVYATLDMKEEGKEALNKALEISTNLQMHPKVLETYKVFAKFYQTIDNKDAALEALNKFVVIYDSVLFIQQIEVLREVTSNYETKQSLQLTKQELETQKSERTYMIIIIALMIIIVVISFWRINYQNKLNRRLKEANNTKNKLFSVISHDLRSPFNTILGFSEILKSTIKEDNEEALKYSDIIYHQSLETVRSIDNLLTWSRSQSNKIIFNPTKINVDKIFEDLRSSYEYLITKNNIKLEFSNEVKNTIKVDKNIVNIILTNLISNSFKFTEENGKIVISARLINKKVEFVVKDNGIGIDKETLNKIRSNKNLESNRGIRNEDGTGLGISICRDLCKLHKGKLIIDSQVGKGTEISVILSLVS